MQAKSRLAIARSIEQVCKSGGDCCLVTLTSRQYDWDGYLMGREWRRCKQYLIRRGQWATEGVRVVERHESGGYHYHIVVARCYAVALRDTWTLGRSDIRDIYLVGGVCQYLSADMTKAAQKKELVRRWSAWGNVVRVRDVTLSTPESRMYAWAWSGCYLRRNSRYRIMGMVTRLVHRGLEPMSRWQMVRECRRTAESTGSLQVQFS